MKSSVIFIHLFFLIIIRTDAQTVPPQCASSYRAPGNSDISVTCGVEFMDLSILLCPIYYVNIFAMTLNGKNREECRGTADWTADPPVLRFRLYIEEHSLQLCDNVFRIMEWSGSEFSSWSSNYKTVNISGVVVSVPSPGLINYRPEISFPYSCMYPLEYIVDIPLSTVTEMVPNETVDDGSVFSSASKPAPWWWALLSSLLSWSG